jgi:HPt (histidine-containing phosphotransfer) domain-containing protein
MPIVYDDADEQARWELVPQARAGADTAAPEAVDLAALRGFEEIQAEGEPDLVVELIDLYLEDAPRKLALMLEAAAGADEESLRRAAHSLKGSSASLGAFGAASLCAELERTDCRDSSGRAGALLARLGQELERVREAFAAERRKRS